jgi:hypothetical protein
MFDHFFNFKVIKLQKNNKMKIMLGHFPIAFGLEKRFQCFR